MADAEKEERRIRAVAHGPLPVSETMDILLGLGQELHAAGKAKGATEERAKVVALLHEIAADPVFPDDATRALRRAADMIEKGERKVWGPYQRGMAAGALGERARIAEMIQRDIDAITASAELPPYATGRLHSLQAVAHAIATPSVRREGPPIRTKRRKLWQPWEYVDHE